MKVQVVWFKRDLRITDHRPLLAASTRGPCILLYSYEPDLMQHKDFDPMHLAVINESLQELDQALKQRGAWLTFRHGRVPEIFADIHQITPIETIWSHQETGNDLTYQRDLRLGEWCKEQGVRWREFTQNGVIRRLKNRDGWSRRWKKRMQRPIFEAPDQVTPLPQHPPGHLMNERDLKLPVCNRPERWQGGESRGWETLHSFLETRGEHYQTGLSSPVSAFAQCSRLSLYLAYGNLSMKQVAQATWQRQKEVREHKKATGTKTPWAGSLRAFQARLHWRDHFTQKLEDQPDLEWVNQSRAYDGIRENAFNPAFFDAWCQGKTGYPMVDACMRALHLGGWINFRMRAMLMSFASYHLWLHWRPTALYLARQFVDYEPGIHYTQAQMQAGVTGINAIRIYSPTKQVKDQDPKGHFIRKYVPELADVPDRHLPEPSKMSPQEQEQAGCRIGKDYPAPLVVHAEAVKRAKSILYGIRRQSETKEESAAIYERHGSRRRPNHRGNGEKPKS